MKYILLIITALAFISLVGADQFGYNGIINSGFGFDSPASSTTTSINYSLANVNNSLYWQGHTGTDGSWLTGISIINRTYATWPPNYTFYNKFWYNGTLLPQSPWLYSTGLNLNFNDTNLATTFYNASTVTTVRGTPAGNLGYIQTYNDVSYNVSEQTGGAGLDLQINFTGITSFNQLIFRYHSSSGENHITKVQIWEYATSTWQDYATLSDVPSYNVKEIGIFDPTEHISNGVVQVRFYSADTGISNHIHYFDWVTIAKGYGTPSGSEIDPLSIHNPMNSNLKGAGYNITNITKITGLDEYGGVSIEFKPSVSDTSARIIFDTNYYDYHPAGISMGGAIRDQYGSVLIGFGNPKLLGGSDSWETSTGQSIGSGSAFYIVGGGTGTSDDYTDGVNSAIDFNGGIAVAVSTAYDISLMKNISYLCPQPSNYLCPITFQWNEQGLNQFADASSKTGIQTGHYSAQDVQMFYPECIIPEKLKQIQITQKETATKEIVNSKTQITTNTNVLNYDRNCVALRENKRLTEKIISLEKRIEILESKLI